MAMAYDALENTYFHAQLRPASGEAAQVQTVANALMISFSQSRIAHASANSA
jgi:hypothetical protein